jgi:archaellum component FlaC
VDLSGLSRRQVDDQIELINSLMAKSDADLKKISGRKLNTNQQDAVTQIKSYLEQANKAVKDGDVQRAHNLAVKANLLSAELVGH